MGAGALERGRWRSSSRLAPDAAPMLHTPRRPFGKRPSARPIAALLALAVTASAQVQTQWTQAKKGPIERGGLECVRVVSIGATAELPEPVQWRDSAVAVASPGNDCVIGAEGVSCLPSGWLLRQWSAGTRDAELAAKASGSDWHGLRTMVRLCGQAHLACDWHLAQTRTGLNVARSGVGVRRAKNGLWLELRRG